MSFLNLKVGSQLRKVTVINAEKVEVDVRGETSEKIRFSVSQPDGKSFQISDVWTEDNKGNKKIQGLWLSLNHEGNISPNSSLAKLMRYYKISDLNELIGKEVNVYPDNDNFLVMTSCKMDEENLEKSSLFE
jgi:hypothetical protein